jgi:hypothetical protein
MIKRLLLTAALVCGPAQAEFFTGNDLLQMMDGDTYADKGMALGFVAGVSDVWNSISVCPPKNVTLGQTHDIARRHLRDNPQTRHMTAESQVRIALEKVWPCRRGTGV